MSLRVDMTGNGSGLQQMLNTGKTQIKAFSNSVEHELSSSWGSIGKNFAAGIAGAFTFQGLKSSVQWFVNTGKEINDQAEQVNMSADSWQKWKDAVDRANLSTGGFMHVLESLHQKRTEALTDPKARGELNKLGFSDDDITGNMDMDEFTKRTLANANGGDQQRRFLADVIGSRGVKYSTALGYLPNENAAFSPDDIKESEEASASLKKLGDAAALAGVAIISNLTGNKKATTQTGAYWNAFMNEPFGKNFFARVAGKANASSDATGFFDHGYKPVKPRQTDSQRAADRKADEATFQKVFNLAKAGNFAEIGKMVQGGGLGFSDQRNQILRTLGVPKSVYDKMISPAGSGAEEPSKDPLDAVLAQQKDDPSQPFLYQYRRHFL
jgi:hypothetical protein